MKKTTVLRKGAAVLGFLLLTVVLLRAVDFLLVDDVHSYSRVMLQELYAEAGQIDTLFLGSSHCYRSVDPAAVDERLDTHSFNAGSSQQLPDGSYAMLQEAASQNELKTVYLEMFYTGYNQAASRDVPMACYLLTDFMRWNSPYRYPFLWEMGAWRRMPEPAASGAARHCVTRQPAVTLESQTHRRIHPGQLPVCDLSGRGRGLPRQGVCLYRGHCPGWLYNAAGCQRRAAAFRLRMDLPEPHRRFLRAAGNSAGAVHGTVAQRLRFQHGQLPGLCGGTAGVCRATRHGVLGFLLYREHKVLDLNLEDFSDAHHLNGAGAEKFTAVLCDVIARDAAGEDTAALFCDSVEEKLTEYPDNTIFMADAMLNS